MEAGALGWDFHYVAKCPFGEELSAGVGIRSASNGYSGDSVRQKFEQYERDFETGLDFAQARYYASVQGRFTSVDPMLSSGRIEVPQSWNRYSFTLNNPLKYVDPLGLYEFDPNATDDQKKKFRAAYDQLKKVRDSFSEKSNDRKRLDKIIAAIGEEGHGGPAVKFAELGEGKGKADYRYEFNGEGNKVKYTTTLTFDSNSDVDVAVLGHEGQHISDYVDALESTVARGGRYITPVGLNLTDFRKEDRGFEISQIITRQLGTDLVYDSDGRTFELYKTSWERIDGDSIPTVRGKMLLSRWQLLRESSDYRLTPRSPGDRIVK